MINSETNANVKKFEFKNLDGETIVFYCSGTREKFGFVCGCEYCLKRPKCTRTRHLSPENLEWLRKFIGEGDENV